jgi:hypothetical protein
MNSCSKTYKGIPRSSAQTDAIIADTEAAHAVLVAAQRTHLVATQNIPYLNDKLAFIRIVRGRKKEGSAYLALEVIVACEQ